MRKIILIFVLALLLTSCSLPGLGTSVRVDGIVEWEEILRKGRF